MNKLTKKGLVLVGDYKDDADALALSEKDLLCSLRDQIEIDDDITLRDLFRIFAPIKLFIEAYSSIPFDDYAKELDKPTDWAKKESCPIDYIEVAWSGEYFERYNSLSLYPDARGVNESVPEEKHGVWENEDTPPPSRYWGIDAQPMNSICDLPIKINNLVTIYKLEDGKKIIEKWKKDFMLLEFLDAIFYEISFFGTPEDRDDFMGVLNERVKEVENMTEEEKKIRLVPIEDVLKRLDELDKEDDV